MTGTGKTTVGKALSEKLNCGFFDLDLIITEKTKKTPSEIFAIYGEEYFRKIETEELENVFKYHKTKIKQEKINIILSCGGGIILKQKNRELLKENSYVIWLHRPVSEIIKNDANKDILKRPPINGDINNYTQIFRQRENLYSETCDLRIEYTDVLEAVETITQFIN